MKYIKNFEEWNPVEWVAPQRENPSYKKDIKKKKKKKSGEMEPVMVLTNKVKDIIMMKPKF